MQASAHNLAGQFSPSSHCVFMMWNPTYIFMYFTNILPTIIIREEEEKKFLANLRMWR